jgi:hypothetical protein
MGVHVIAIYKPKPGKAHELLQVVREHLPILRGQKLATDSPSLVLRATDGTLIEIFEWVSEEAVRQAHTNKAVLELWGRFEHVCTFGTLTGLPDSDKPFPHYERVEL